MASKRITDATKRRLSEEFNGHCAYCTIRLGPDGAWTPHCYRPKSRYPELAADPANLLPVCIMCDQLSADHFPTTPEGEPLLVNPRVDMFEDHIKIDDDGKAVALTNKGDATIKVFILNRPHLIEMRRAELQAQQYFRDLDLHLPEPLKVLKKSVSIVRALSQGLSRGGRIADLKDAEAGYLRNLLYANVIAAMESYLSDTLVGLVMQDDESLRDFVESFLDFKKEKFELREVFARHESIREHSRKALREIIFHDLPKVAGVYKDACGIDLPDFGSIMTKILIRHDIVHRNGKTKEDVAHTINAEDLEALCGMVETFVTKTEVEVEKVRSGGTT